MTKNSKDEKVAQYERLAEDWRHYDEIIWQLPSVAVAIMAGIIGVAYQFLSNHPFIRFLLLLIGSLFIFALAIALAKHRFFMDARTRFLAQLEKELNIEVFPIETGPTAKYLENNDGATKNRLFNFLAKRRAAIWLLYVIFIAGISLAIMTVTSFIQSVLLCTGIPMFSEVPCIVSH